MTSKLIFEYMQLKQVVSEHYYHVKNIAVIKGGNTLY